MLQLTDALSERCLHCGSDDPLNGRRISLPRRN